MSSYTGDRRWRQRLAQASGARAKRRPRRADRRSGARAFGLIEPARRLNAIITGSDGLFGTRHLENEAVRNGHRLINNNVALGDQLSLTVSGLVDRARKDIDTATTEAPRCPTVWRHSSSSVWSR